MTRYFFHVIDGQVSIDTEGLELATMDDVRKEAVLTAGGILRDAKPASLSKAAWSMTVADQTGKTVYSLKFEATDYE